MHVKSIITLQTNNTSNSVFQEIKITMHQDADKGVAQSLIMHHGDLNVEMFSHGSIA